MSRCSAVTAPQSALAEMRLRASIGVRVLAQARESEQQIARLLVQAVQAAVETDVGRAARDGGRVDVYA